MIPDEVQWISDNAFYSTSLTKVTIPAGVEKILMGAFSDCTSLTSVYIKATTPPTGAYSSFRKNVEGFKIYVPMEAVDTYKAADCWKEYADYIEGYDF